MILLILLSLYEKFHYHFVKNNKNRYTLSKIPVSPLFRFVSCIINFLLTKSSTDNWLCSFQDLRFEGDNKRVLANYLESKKRKLGKLPPVYPNGWFALLESSQLDKGQVKHVAALGQNFAVFRYFDKLIYKKKD